MFSHPAARIGIFLNVCLCLAFLVACGGGRAPLSSGGGPVKKLTQITVSPASNAMPKGTWAQLAAKAVYSAW